MPVIAKLQFGDNTVRRYSREYLLADFKCHLTRSHNEARPDGSARCDRMDLTVVAPGMMDLNLYEWYVDQSVLSGRILVALPSPNQDEEWKEILFEDGVCFSISEEYHIDVRLRRMLTLGIAAENVVVDEIIFTNR